MLIVVLGPLSTCVSAENVPYVFIAYYIPSIKPIGLVTRRAWVRVSKETVSVEILMLC